MELSVMRALRRFLAPCLAVIGLAACAGQPATPPIAFDKAAFQPAKVEVEPPKAITVVAVPQPLPLPAQLMLAPTAPKSEAAEPAKRVAAANKAAMQEPTGHGYINAVQVYPWTDGVLYRLYAAPGQVTDIALQPGEALSSVAAGDTVRWTVGDTSSGSAESKQIHVLVRPSAPGLTTNLLIMTDRRSYHLALESTEHTAMAVISWTYPQDMLVALQSQAKAAEEAQPVATGLSLSNLHFRYAVSGDRPPWRPERVFDDGAKVYIAFPERIDQGEAPPLFVLGPKGDAQLVNYRVRGAYYIVDRLFAAAELRLGERPQLVVRITRTDVQPTLPAPGKKG
jgi:type IV secretion system protein TrbG